MRYGNKGVYEKSLINITLLDRKCPRYWPEMAFPRVATESA
jgi:hypothetical protein